MKQQFTDRGELLDIAVRRRKADPVSLTVRELIHYWDARSRGRIVVRNIRSELKRKGIAAEPDFALGHIDSTIRLVPAESAKPPEESERDSDDSRFLRVDSLRCAGQGVDDLPMDTPIGKAMTRMAMKDFSQLAVTSGRQVRGAISWESIGKASLVKEVKSVRDAITPAQTARQSEDLLPLLPRIAEAGFLLVQANDQTLTGIITAADVTDEFGALAEPFFLVGEIERRLRFCVVSAGFSTEELSAVRATEGRAIASVDDLTLGEVERLLEAEANWRRLGWGLDRREFLSTMSVVREIRNGLMHFSADLPSVDEVNLMRNFLGVIKGHTDR